MFSDDEVRTASGQLKIETIKGDVAPRYPVTSKHLLLSKVVVTEKGTEGGLPIVDFVMFDEAGQEHYFMITGRLVNMLSSALKGINLRNHGTEEP